LRLITTCEHVGRILFYFEARDEFGIDFAQLDHSVQRMGQLLQQRLMASALTTLPTCISAQILEIWMNQYELSLENCSRFFSLRSLILALSASPQVTSSTSVNTLKFITIIIDWIDFV